ncbi:uncharacterized protein LOC111863636 isoform X2 [Cryptotermes secundus]|uniref:uncharacterized protein LOC111863636 isoform X2 n=1 Tax=Cryptotermes secundus TaxID=105785 RepID=UPI001454C13C|nr:uncharacterized protein LOC111863636 isoform X2 [Cryptotermes secundus]
MWRLHFQRQGIKQGIKQQSGRHHKINSSQGLYHKTYCCRHGSPVNYCAALQVMLRSWLHCHCELNIRATKSRKTTTLKCTIERRNSNHYQLTQRMRKEWTDSNAALQAVQMMTLNNARMATHERQ